MERRNIGILAALVFVAAAAAIVIPRAFAKSETPEAQEEDVALDALPAAVQATLLEACEGATPEEVELENENGQVVYEADVVIDGVEYEIQVAMDGALVGKKAEGDEDDDALENDDHEDEDEEGDVDDDEDEEDEDDD